MKLKAWQNGMGYDFGSWELVRMSNGTWSAANKPKWFGRATHLGLGGNYAQAIQNAKPTDEYVEFLDLQKNKAAA